MRKFLTGLLILMTALVCQAGSNPLRDPGDAWPWGAELPFPWRGIQGTWETTIKGRTIYFTFVTVRSENDLNQLQVREYSATNCKLLAKGAGYEQDRVVKALMVSPSGTFNLTVHVFKQSDLRDSGAPGYVEVRGAKTITVMNVSPLGGGLSSRVTYQLQKVDSDPEGLCASKESSKYY